MKKTKKLSGAKLLADIHQMLQTLEQTKPDLHTRMKNELTKILRQYQKDIALFMNVH